MWFLAVLIMATTSLTMTIATQFPAPKPYTGPPSFLPFVEVVWDTCPPSDASTPNSVFYYFLDKTLVDPPVQYGMVTESFNIPVRETNIVKPGF